MDPTAQTPPPVSSLPERVEPPGSGGPPRAPATVAAGNGIEWWSRGWHIFAASPLVWIAITILYGVIVIMLGLIPIIGPIAATVLSPVLAGGVMLGCRSIDRGSGLTIGHLFMCFADRMMPLIILGVIYLLVGLVIAFTMAAVMVATIGVSGLSAMMSGDPLASLATFGFGTLLAILLGMVLWLPLMMAYWFAPALVVFRNIEPWTAMKSSFTASLVNVVPMLLYSLLGLLFSIIATIPFGLGWLVLLPVFAGTVYASFKDIYGDAA